MTSAWFLFVAIGLGAGVISGVAAWRARRRIREGEPAMATVIELLPAEFGAQNFSSVLERNGLRSHVVELDGGESPHTTVVRSYWWRESGSRVKVVQVRANGCYVFAADTYFPAMFFALAGLLSVAIAVLLHLGPFE